jgi:hypothetical protein
MPSTSRIAALIGCLIAFSCVLICSGQNLVPNPSFELTDTCPNTCCFPPGDRPLHWNRWDQSPDYFNACAGDLGGIDTLMDVPQNGFTWQYAHDGEAYVGMTCYEPNDFREHVGALLLEPLVVGQTYYVSYWVNLATEGLYWETRWACNNQGLLFTMDEHLWSGQTGSVPEFVPRNYAHVNNSFVITDSANWTLVSGNFVADSAYRYIVLGNFFNDAMTDTVHLNPSLPSWAAYYLYDDICVSPTPGHCPVATGLSEQGKATLSVRVLGGGQWLQVEGVETDVRCGIYGAGGGLVEQFTFNGSYSKHIGNWPESVYVLHLQEGSSNPRYVKFVVIR